MSFIIKNIDFNYEKNRLFDGCREIDSSTELEGITVHFNYEYPGSSLVEVEVDGRMKIPYPLCENITLKEIKDRAVAFCAPRFDDCVDNEI